MRAARLEKKAWLCDAEVAREGKEHAVCLPLCCSKPSSSHVLFLPHHIYERDYFLRYPLYLLGGYSR